MKLLNAFAPKPKPPALSAAQIHQQHVTVPYQAPVGQLPSGHGPSPSGSMSMLKDTGTHLAGYNSSATIVIKYKMQSGVQKRYHSNPGSPYPATERIAYLPDNQEGQELLVRLHIAFLRGLTFNIGTSQTTGQANVIVWASIPHKTTLQGPFGYSDVLYIGQCNAALDALGVPSISGGSSPSPSLPPPILPPVDKIVRYEAPRSLALDVTKALTPVYNVLQLSECAICLDSLNGWGAQKLIACHHVFHGRCIVDCLQQSRNCPVCRQAVGEPMGPSPSGQMKIQVISKTCPGFDDDGTSTIQMEYNIPSGQQHDYHPNPGTCFTGTSRTAYLPYNSQGVALLQRLTYAFTHGLTFLVGTSFTTGETNTTIWSSIHHKTSLRGGPHGFPDPDYLDNCNATLDALGVPPGP